MLSVISKRSFLNLFAGVGSASDIIRAEGVIIHLIICDPGYRDEVRTEIRAMLTEPPLRPRICRGPGCRAMFFVCRRCYRGQRYFSEGCRAAARRRQQRAASGRYQTH